MSKEAIRAARVLQVISIDGCENLSRVGRTLISVIALDAEGNLSSALYNLGSSESNESVGFALCVGMILFYGMLVRGIGLIRKDRGQALRTMAPAMLTSWCHGGPYTSVEGDCYYHQVLQPYIRDYACKDGSDGGDGTTALQWIKLILKNAITVQQETMCFQELLAWVRRDDRSPFAERLTKFVQSVMIYRHRLGIAHIPRHTPTFHLLGTWNESDNFAQKHGVAQGKAARNLQKQGHNMRAVALQREFFKVRGIVLPEQMVA